MIEIVTIICKIMFILISFQYILGLVKGPGIKSRHKRNVLLQMEKGYQGPLDAIKKCMENRLRVKVNI